MKAMEFKEVRKKVQEELIERFKEERNNRFFQMCVASEMNIVYCNCGELIVHLKGEETVLCACGEHTIVDDCTDIIW